MDQKKTLERLTEHRRTLHQIPEICNNLYKTRDYILSVIGDFDCEITDHCNTGLCAFFDKGKDTTVAFRTDMDALPVTEVNDVPYKSRHEGQMHACGHDGHMAMVLGLAEYVNSHDTKHNILLVFQPSEETIGGAKEICESGIFQKHNTIAMFGIHMWPFAAAGDIQSKPGPLMSRFCIVDIDFTGVSAHATQPENGVNALHAAGMYISDVYEKHAEICRAAKTAEDKTILGMTVAEGGTAFNIIPNKVWVRGCIRAFTDDNFEMLQETIRNTAKEAAGRIGAGVDVRFSEGYPVLYNNDELFEKVKDLGIGDIGDPLLISEDFAFYGKEVPSVMFLLGTGNGIALHSNNFNFDEEVLVKGLELYIKLIDRM